MVRHSKLFQLWVTPYEHHSLPLEIHPWLRKMAAAERQPVLFAGLFNHAGDRYRLSVKSLGPDRF